MPCPAATAAICSGSGIANPGAGRLSVSAGSAMRAGIALALSFDTWRPLVRDQDLSEAEAIEVAARLSAPSP
jgi:hypothetical protein